MGLPLDETQATCVVTGIVDVVDVAALTEAGISPDEFAAADNYASLSVELPDDATADLGAAGGEAPRPNTTWRVDEHQLRQRVALNITDAQTAARRRAFCAPGREGGVRSVRSNRCAARAAAVPFVQDLGASFVRRSGAWSS